MKKPNKNTEDQCVDHYVEEAKGCFRGFIARFGGILTLAGKSISREEYARCVTRLCNDLYLTKRHIDAAIAINAGTLDERLFFSGVALSKILTLTKGDQARLLSGEMFPLLAANNKIEKKPWADMTVRERDQLLGSKGGGIRTVDEQRHKVRRIHSL
jgi:hypothetical protein